LKSPLVQTLESLSQAAYSTGYAQHGDLNLELRQFVPHLALIASKHVGPDPTVDTLQALITRLCAADLYLAAACSHNSESAWHRFSLLHRQRLRRAARCFCSSPQEAAELADSVMGHLFLPDKSGRSRIMSYDGLSPLSAWLITVLKRNAIKQRKRTSGRFEPLESIPDIPDHRSEAKLGEELRASKYGELIATTFRDAVTSLTERQRLFLYLHYEQELQTHEIARIFQVSCATVNRQLGRAKEALRDETVLALSCTHGLSAPAVEECLAELLENPELSIPTLAAHG